MRKLLLAFLLCLLTAAGAFAQCTPNAALVLTNPSTCGGANGSIKVPGIDGTLSGYSITYRFNGGPVTTATSISSDGSSITINGLKAGSYTNIQGIYNGGSCSFSISGPYSLWDPAPTPLIVTPSATAICPGQSVTLTASGGSGYTWTNSGNLNTTTGSVVIATPSIGTTYQEFAVVGKDVNNCTSEGRTAITINTPTAAITSEPTACFNGASPNVTFTGSGSKAPYTFTYKVNGGGSQTTTSTGNIATVAVPTNVSGNMIYSLVSVADANSCSRTLSGSTTVKINAEPSVSAIVSQTVCNNSTTTAVIFGGVGNVFNWSNSNAAIGLSSTGVGNIAAFTAVNTTTAPITSTITVTPKTIANGFAYVPTSFNNTVSVFNTATNALVATIPVGTTPNGVAVSPDGSKVYIANSNSGTVSVINASSNTVSATITVGSSPSGIAVSPNGNRVYVSNLNSNNVSVIDASTNTVIATVTVETRPKGIVISPDGSKVYVANNISNSVSVIATSDNTVVATISSVSAPNGMAITPDGSKLYVANDGGAFYSVTSINTATNTVITKVPVGDRPVGVAVSPDGSKVYVTSSISHNITVVSTANHAVLATTTVGFSPTAISFTPDGTQAYVVNASSENISVINTATNAVTTTFHAGGSITAFGNFMVPGQTCVGTPTTFAITVNPTVTVNPVSNATYCNGATGAAVNFSSPNTGGTIAYAWTSSANVGFGTSGTGNIAAYTAVNPGTTPITATVTVTPTYTNDGTACTGTPTTFTITVNPIATVTAQVINNLYCNGQAGFPINFSSPTTGGTIVYNWTASANIGFGTSGNGNIPMYAVTNNGATPVVSTVTVTPSFTNGGITCTGTPINFTITVNPTATVDAIPNATYCNNAAGAAIGFSTALTGGATTYGWTSSANVGFGTSGTGDIAAFTATNTGSAPIVATITVTPSFTNNNATCVGASKTFTITVNPTPTTPTIATSGATTFCAGGSVTLTSSATAGNQWYKDGTLLTGATNQTYVANTTGVYTVRATQNTCTSVGSTGTTITVTPLPTQPTITVSGNVLTSSATSGNQWYLNGALLPGATNATYNVQAAGQYTVMVTQSNCSATSAAYNFTTTGIVQPITWNGEVAAYPNPVARILYIKNAAKRKLDLQLVDVLGQLIYRSQLHTTAGTIDMSGVAAGTYRLLVTDINKNETISLPIIKQ